MRGLGGHQPYKQANALATDAASRCVFVVYFGQTVARDSAHKRGALHVCVAACVRESGCVRVRL